jgi:hypothetical protein
MEAFASAIAAQLGSDPSPESFNICLRDSSEFYRPSYVRCAVLKPRLPGIAERCCGFSRAQDV